ncbi:MAG: hypothetical protein A2275_01920 [Bacteroidetes bacterium RIFOXYA12_FULL_35_11]|nr:MAG: hypothetical protein A2X01_16355 [Bacteroidetes bacterium GWF2_35_48]OFY75333.1 MAG: hypothetical protein A2275_01920 [Bacteroidetes bacterium RIFOXYA12_FULL_35_11]OFY94830.1 MAG: hypothetical protein A2491_14420 [Bacteroidetes bacterium RIFOXYC12_FULL_35_7]OFY96908.1 MAG: hypothetical protein A2309_08210 [Bacteroidetes bacterium RIFOXYB2_FULL_35_7]HBX53466.1 hypothetical protein [Bacteroidales bacterium]
MTMNKYFKRKIIILVLFIFSVFVSSCKKCYYCQAKQQGIEEAIDFAKSCGTKEENKKMEDEFRAKYQVKDGYTVYCK